jgi:hypothetical protein
LVDGDGAGADHGLSDEPEVVVLSVDDVDGADEESRGEERGECDGEDEATACLADVGVSESGKDPCEGDGHREIGVGLLWFWSGGGVVHGVVVCWSCYRKVLVVDMCESWISLPRVRP